MTGRFITYTRFTTPSDFLAERYDRHSKDETLQQRFRRGLMYLGVARPWESVVHFHSLSGLMNRVGRVKGLNVLMGDEGDIYGGMFAPDFGKAAVLRYEFARRQANLFFLDYVLETHQPGVSPDQLRRLCLANCPTFEDIQWFEATFRRNTRRRNSPKPTGRPKASNGEHVALMKELYATKSLLEVAKELLARGIRAPSGKPYSPQNVDYYLHRRKK
jgi:hypothetical protein